MLTPSARVSSQNDESNVTYKVAYFVWLFIRCSSTQWSWKIWPQRLVIFQWLSYPQPTYVKMAIETLVIRICIPDPGARVTIARPIFIWRGVNSRSSHWAMTNTTMQCTQMAPAKAGTQGAVQVTAIKIHGRKAGSLYIYRANRAYPGARFSVSEIYPSSW